MRAVPRNTKTVITIDILTVIRTRNPPYAQLLDRYCTEMLLGAQSHMQVPRLTALKTTSAAALGWTRFELVCVCWGDWRGGGGFAMCVKIKIMITGCTVIALQLLQAAL